MTDLEFLLTAIIASETGIILAFIKNIIKRCPQDETPKVGTNKETKEVCPECNNTGITKIPFTDRIESPCWVCGQTKLI
jgi:hypothetical protein